MALHVGLNAREKSLKEREDKLVLDQLTLDKTILEVKLEEAIQRANTSKELVSLVFKNPTFKTVEQHYGKRVRDGFSQYNGLLSMNTFTEPDYKSVEKKIVQEDL